MTAKSGVNRRTWQVALTYVGTVVGAGFASGKEIVVFFGVFGLWGLAGAVLSGVLFAVLGRVIIEASARRGAGDYEEFLRMLFGRRACFFDKAISGFLLTFLAAMLVGGGCLLAHILGIAPGRGFLLTLLASYLLLLTGFEGMLWFNTLFVPVLTVSCSVVAVAGIFDAAGVSGKLAENAGALQDSWLLGAFLYVAYNLTTGMVVLVSLGDSTKRDNGSGGVLGGIILGILAALIGAALIFQGSEVMQKELPMLALAEHTAPVLGAFYQPVLLLAILTTALSNGAALLKRFKSGRTRPRPLLPLLILAPSLVFYNWPLTKMVETVYPLLGYVGLIMLAAVIIRIMKTAKT